MYSPFSPLDSSYKGERRNAHCFFWPLTLFASFWLSVMELKLEASLEVKEGKERDWGKDN